MWNDIAGAAFVSAVPIAGGAVIGAYTDAYDHVTGAAKGAAIAVLVEGAVLGAVILWREGMQRSRAIHSIKSHAYHNNQMVVDGTYYPRQSSRLKTWVTKKVDAITRRRTRSTPPSTRHRQP